MLVGVSLVPRVEKPAGLDVGEPFCGYSANVGSFPLSGSRLAKARQWCRALQRQIRATWWATVETDTHLASGGVIHDEPEAVMVEAGLSVAAVQVLYDIFLGAHPRRTLGDMATSAFEVESHSSSDGQVVSGLKLIRNGEIHADCIVVPDVNRVVGVTFEDGSQGYRIFPHWATYRALPAGVRDARHSPRKGSSSAAPGKLKTNQVHHDHYRQVVAGQPVIETLLEALAFFARCDPRIVRLDGAGNPRHFPLEPISEHDYERRHPDWPSRVAVEAKLRTGCEMNPPSGVRRTCTAHLEDTAGNIIAHCGFTTLRNGIWTPFAETPEQVRRDVVDFGYPYWVEQEGESRPLIIDAGGELVADPDVSELSQLRSGKEPPWADVFSRARSDAFDYRKQRKPDQ